MSPARQIPSWIASCDHPDDAPTSGEGVDLTRAGGVGVYAGFRRIRSISEAYRCFDALPPKRQADHIREYQLGREFEMRARGML